VKPVVLKWGGGVAVQCGASAAT